MLFSYFYASLQWLLSIGEFMYFITVTMVVYISVRWCFAFTLCSTAMHNGFNTELVQLSIEPCDLYLVLDCIKLQTVY